jgi:hypothetical protein
MTVRRGSEWGEEVAIPADALTVRSDRELAAALAAGADRPLLLRGGDLHRSLGSPSGGAAAGRRLSIDVLRVVTDGGVRTAVAHVLARRPGPLGWWRGPLVLVSNVDHVGTWDAAPRAHPNDGRLDVIDVSASMGVRARFQARARLRTGTHLPHPDIITRRARHAAFEFAAPLAVWVDAERWGTTRSLSVEVDPDAAAIYV